MPAPRSLAKPLPPPDDSARALESMDAALKTIKKSIRVAEDGDGPRFEMMAADLRGVAAWIEASKARIAAGKPISRPMFRTSNDDFYSILAGIMAGQNTTWWEQQNLISLLAAKANQTMESWLARSDTDESDSGDDSMDLGLEDGSDDTDDE